MSDPICCVYCRQRITQLPSTPTARGEIPGIWVHVWSGLNACGSDGHQASQAVTALTWDGRSGMILLARPGFTIPLPSEPWPPGWDRLGQALIHHAQGILTADLHTFWTGGQPALTYMLEGLTAPAPPAPLAVAWDPDDDGPALAWPIRSRVGCGPTPGRAVGVRVQWEVGPPIEVWPSSGRPLTGRRPAGAGGDRAPRGVPRPSGPTPPGAAYTRRTP